MRCPVLLLYMSFGIQLFVTVLYVRSTAKVIYGREKLRKKEEPDKETGEDNVWNFDPNNAADGQCRETAPISEESTTSCSIIRCTSKKDDTRQECRPEKASVAVVSIRMLAESKRSQQRCRERITYGPTVNGSIWVDGGCDAHFQVCYVTEKSDQACSSKAECGINADCHDGRCRCRRGHMGNPYVKCEDLCVCSAYGDPHYKGYDKQTFTFNGACRYTLTEYNKTGDPGCHFTVDVRNERRGNRWRVSFTRSVHIKIYNLTITLAKDKRVFINEIAKFLPVKIDNPDVSIYSTGEYARLVTGCGISVSWNGRSEVFVSVPRSYGNYLFGICGNCNGKQDDYKTKDGRDVSKERKRNKLLGDSYLVEDSARMDTDECITDEIYDPCTGEMDKYVQEIHYCGMLLITEKYPNPFKECVSNIPDISKDLYTSCRYDACSYFHDKRHVREIVCQALDALSAECEERGYYVKWRSRDFCPLRCQENMYYSSDVSGCPATCVNQQPDPSKCQQSSTSGCACRSGYLLSSHGCVKKEECGCESEMGYLPIGEKYITTNCKLMIKCAMVNEELKLIKQPLELKCHAQAGCGLLDGVPSCACNDGYFGDGITRCEPLCNGKRCGSFARCKDRRCQCFVNYHGNPYHKCEPLGICDGEKCAVNATCINYNCICKKNHIGDGYRTCKRLCGGRRCGENADCINEKCHCTPGYHGHPYSKCEPNQQCGGTTCVQNAKCIYFQCLCNIGYYGNGTTECKALCDGKRCVKNAECKNDECVCKEGFHGNGNYKCEKHGVCDGEICAKGATCINSVCVCPTGHYGDPYTLCKPLCGKKKCANNAECFRGTCMCLEGYHGDGTILCEPHQLCNGKKCEQHAVCFNYQCVCERRYSGDPYVKCSLLCRGRKCVEHAYCYRDSCYCKDGFHGNGYIKCEPKNVCGGKTCTAFAKCINYECVCKDGYVGNGTHECEELCDNGRCAEYAKCVNGKCQCIDGYRGIGNIKCEPLDYCDGKRCALHAKCWYYRCLCQSGYVGDGYTVCERLCNGQKCAKDAECRNGECSCKDGYHGNGSIACEPLSTCGEKQCADNAVCTNYQCQCKHGYYGNGYNNCTKLCRDGMCVLNAECRDEQCECSNGYHGNGQVLCEPIGMCGGKTCRQNAHCYNYRCVCDAGYIGDGIEKCEPYCNDQQCALYAYCDANECVCQNGYKGNPYVKCEPINLCDGKVCPAFSECVNYQCKCLQEYIQDANKKCVPLCNGKRCIDNAVCNENGRCECIKGYHGNALIKCEPQSVCGGRICSEFADCVNYVCKCKEGFYSTDPYKGCNKLCKGRQCAMNASCRNEECVCNEGFHGDGYIRCEESGKCDGKTCVEHASCKYYHCVCDLGYYGNGYKLCLPYCKGQKCVEHAKCSNEGCICEEGYHGDGTIKCEPNGYCDGVRCSDHAECINYRCHCRPGYYGNGYNCIELCGDKKCVPYSKCKNATCVCQDGYHGNGFVLCEPLEQCGGKQCAPHADCENFNCRCIYGYHGYGYNNCTALCNNRKCVEFATCCNGECVCEKGFHGDGHFRCEADGLCDGRTCGDNAHCINFKCVCLNGYIENKHGECQELCSGRQCVGHAFCHYGKCVCENEYHGNGEIECERDGICGGKVCANNTKCVNRHCICADGFVGNGYQVCTRLCGGRKCAEKHSYCDNNVCRCQQGYHGDAFLKCEVIGYCGGNSCATNAMCKGYVCHCKEGYVGDGVTKCEAVCGGRMCTIHAECKSDQCVCLSRYHGNGYYKCEPEGVCNGKKCHKNAHCINFMCLCKRGYFGDGYSRCDEFCGGHLCSSNSRCIDNKCECSDGYQGNGLFKCEPIGLCGGTKCAKHAECYNYRCKCRTGYYGDGKDYCDPKGYCRGTKCADNAVCDDGRCVCRGGYAGDGYVKCGRTCVCVSSGDSHIRTYDGQSIDVNGGCRYTMTKSTVFPDYNAFNVEIDNEIAHYPGNSTWTRAVHVTIYDLKIVLKRNDVYVDEYMRYIPNNLAQNKVQVYKSGYWLVLNAACGLTVWWNGHSSVVVKAPPSYHDHMSGLCGNCNGIEEDDYRSKEGEQFSSYSAAKRDALIAESYLIPSEEVNGEDWRRRCQMVHHPTSLCADKYKEAKCSHLDIQNNKSPFIKCMENYPGLARRIFKACKEDVCMSRNSSKSTNELVCEYMAEFAEECDQRGFQIKFRNSTFCPLECGPNMKYSEAVSGCPATCTNLKPTKCTLPPSEGCECVHGYVLSGDECVKPAMCGCYCPVYFYIPLEKTYVTKNCSDVVKCTLENGKPVLKPESTNIRCHEHGMCGISHGIPHCVCLPGYKGDGYSNCDKIE